MHRLIGRRTENENCSVDCTDFAGPDFRGLWAEPVSEVHPDANAAGNCRPISNCALRIALRVRGRRGAGHWWSAAARQPLCATGSDDSRACDREHPCLSLADGPERAAAGDYSDGALVHGVFPVQAELFGHFRGAASLSQARVASIVHGRVWSYPLRSFFVRKYDPQFLPHASSVKALDLSARLGLIQATA